MVVAFMSAGFAILYFGLKRLRCVNITVTCPTLVVLDESFWILYESVHSFLVSGVALYWFEKYFEH